MGSWRRNAGGDGRFQDSHRPRLQPRKPPHGNRYLGVPSWEKQFCKSVGSVPWGKLVEAKRVMYLYDNIVNWNDSAGEEAFSNAKKRFYAEINGLPCDICLPDPDKYIDKVDWNTAVDPNLLLDLERGQSLNVEKADVSGNVIFGDVLLNQTFACTGWGDTEEAFQKPAEFGNPNPNGDDVKNSWDSQPPQNNDAVIRCTGWGDEWKRDDNSWENNNWIAHDLTDLQRNDNRWSDNHRTSTGNHWNDNHWTSTGNHWNNDLSWNSNQNHFRKSGQQWDWNNQHRRDYGSGNWPRSNKASRFHGNNNHTRRGWRNSREMRRDDLAYQHQSAWIGTH